MWSISKMSLTLIGQLKNNTNLIDFYSMSLSTVLVTENPGKWAIFKRKVLWPMKHCFIGLLQHVQHSELNNFQRALVQISIHKGRENQLSYFRSTINETWKKIKAIDHTWSAWMLRKFLKTKIENFHLNWFLTYVFHKYLKSCFQCKKLR